MRLHSDRRWLLPIMAAASLLACNDGTTAAAASDAVVANDRRPAAEPSPPGNASESQLGKRPQAVQEAVNALLRAAYPGGFDTANRCWRTERVTGNETVAFCMRPLPHRAVEEGGGISVYLALASASDISGNLDYTYGHADPGMMDVYRLSVAADGTYAVNAKGLGLSFGSAGDCGCAKAQLVQLGPRVHGWAFTAGGTWQGVTVASHSLVAPVGDAFKDVAGLPRYREGDQMTEYRSEVRTGTGAGDWYPLRLTRFRDGKQDASRDINFDPIAATYPAPKDF